MKKLIYFFIATILAATTISCIDSNQALQDAISESKSEFPLTIVEGMEITDVLLSSKYLTYIIETDEDIFDISLLKENKSEVKHGIKEELYSGDEDTEHLLMLLKKTNRGLAYKYVGTETGDFCVVTFEDYEL